jgi:hypothetical protein
VAGDTPRADAPTRELTTAPTTGSEDRCTNCGSPLAHDQRYCVSCGERRGQSRLPTAQPTTEVPATRTRSSRPPRGPRVSSGTTLVAGVGVLLLAIGLGFLIGRVGHNSSQKAASAPPVQVVTVNGGGGGASTTPTTTTPKKTASSSTPKGLNGKLKKAADQTAPPSAAVQKKATQAAGKVLGNSSHLAAPTTSQGGACAGGAGCQNHKFTGNFFGN